MRSHLQPAGRSQCQVPKEAYQFPKADEEFVNMKTLHPAPPLPNHSKPHPNPLLPLPLAVLDPPHVDGSTSVARRLTKATVPLLFGSPVPIPSSMDKGTRVASQDDPGSWPKQAPAGALETHIRNSSPPEKGLDQFTTPFVLTLTPQPMTVRLPDKDPPISSFRRVVANLTLHWVTSWDLSQAQRLWKEGLPIQG